MSFKIDLYEKLREMTIANNRATDHLACEIKDAQRNNADAFNRIGFEINQLRESIDSSKNLNLNDNYNALIEAIQKDDTPANVIEHGEICDEINELYEKKNNDYGNTIEKGINELGMIYLSCQLYNKVNRLMTLTDPNKKVTRQIDESIEDTLLDLANYAIEGVRILRNRNL